MKSISLRWDVPPMWDISPHVNRPEMANRIAMIIEQKASNFLSDNSRALLSSLFRCTQRDCKRWFSSRRNVVKSSSHLPKDKKKNWSRATWYTYLNCIFAALPSKKMAVILCDNNVILYLHEEECFCWI